jgi:hypothetical protein
MTHNLIQDYLDNRLDSRDRLSFEAEMASNPTLAREVEAAAAFKAAVRQSALTEPIPNLQASLANITRPQSTTWFNKIAPIAIASFAVFAIGLAANRVITDRTNPTIASAKTLPPEAKLQTKSALVMHWDGNDPVEGAAHIRKTFYRTFPTIALSDLKGAKFTAAECGSCWINFKYEYQGGQYNIYGRCENGNLDTGSTKKIGKRTFYVFQDAVGWYDKDMTYVCTGGSPKGRKIVAQFASKRTAEVN